MIQAGHVKIKVSFLLQLIDDFTDKEVIDSSIRVTGVNTKPPVRKGNGCYAFINCSGRQTQVNIASSFYLEEKIIVNHTKAGDSIHVIKARLKPGRSYPLPYPFTCLEGTAEEGKTVGMVCEDRDFLWKLPADYEAEKDKNKIKIFNPLEKDLETMCFQIIDGDKRNMEFFKINKNLHKEHTYLIEQPLKHNYAKAGTKLYTFHYTRAGIRGTYFLPVKADITEPYGYTCYYDGTPVKAVLEPFKSNRLDF